jgi:adenylate kinase
MNLVILGPQGSGKGTQAEMLADKYGYNYIEMGKILRSVANSDNKYAQVVREAMNRGVLVPDEFFRLILWDHVKKSDKAKGFIFDGFPRSHPQYEQLIDMLMKFGEKLDKMILITISEEETIRRLSARRTCKKCGRVFNLLTNKPHKDNKCDECGGDLYQREDDKEEAIKKRLETYEKETSGVIEEGRKAKILLEINGERPIEEIYKEIVEKLGL